MLKGVIFDMDGLMIDTEKLLTRFWCEAANHYGYPMTKEHVLGIRSLAAKYAIPHLKGIFGEDFDYYKVRAKRIELMNEFIRQNGIEKKKGLDELLDYLDSTGLKKAVATATDLQRTTLYLSSINIIDRFDKLIIPISLFFAHGFGVAGALGIGLLGFLSAPVMAPENYWIFNPFSYAVRSIVPITKIHPNGIILENTSTLLNTDVIFVSALLAIMCFLIFTLLTSFIFSKSEGN
ncbi:MAG: HAD hydrolase-like protein [Ruminococcus bicirculans (ex Wegman et al. 2014)]